MYVCVCVYVCMYVCSVLKRRQRALSEMLAVCASREGRQAGPLGAGGRGGDLEAEVAAAEEHLPQEASLD